MTDRSTLLGEIDAFRQRHGTSETRFGRDALNDGHFVRRLREGGNITLRTVEKVRAFMAAANAAASAPRPQPQHEREAA
jgi:TnpA family transposase